MQSLFTMSCYGTVLKRALTAVLLQLFGISMFPTINPTATGTICLIDSSARWRGFYVGVLCAQSVVCTKVALRHGCAHCALVP